MTRSLFPSVIALCPHHSLPDRVLSVALSAYLCIYPPLTLCVFLAVFVPSVYLCVALFLLFFFVSLVLFVTYISMPPLPGFHTIFNSLRGWSLPVLIKAPILFLTAQSGGLRGMWGPWEKQKERGFTSLWRVSAGARAGVPVSGLSLKLLSAPECTPGSIWANKQNTYHMPGPSRETEHVGVEAVGICFFGCKSVRAKGKSIGESWSQ